MVTLTDEQAMVRDVAARIAADVRIETPARLDSVDRAGAWAALTDAGLCAMRDREDGEPAASVATVALVVEELGRSLAPLPFVSTMLARELVTMAVDDIATTVDGAAPLALTLADDLGSMVDADGPTASVVWDASTAPAVVGLASTPGGPVVTIAGPNGRAHPIDCLDLTQSLARREPGAADRSGVVVGRPLGPGEEQRWLAYALALVSADILGVMRGALGAAVEYAKHRVQYDRPIGSFQAVQHLCAEGLVKVEASASTVRYAAWAVEALDPGEALLAARVAKAQCSVVGREVCEIGMQVFGGIGQTWEHPAHLHTRRALFDRALFGSEDEQLRAIADTRLGH